MQASPISPDRSSEITRSRDASLSATGIKPQGNRFSRMIQLVSDWRLASLSSARRTGLASGFPASAGQSDGA